MPAPFSVALQEAYASVPATEVVLDTIEIHAIAPDGAHIFTTPIRIVRDDADLLATLEQDAPRDAGAQVTFLSFVFDLTLQPSQATGVPELELGIDNVTDEIEDALDEAVDARAKLVVIYRAYLASNPTAPQNTPVKLIGTRPVADDATQKITMRCSAADWMNKRVPSEDYTRARFPGLSR